MEAGKVFTPTEILTIDGRRVLSDSEDWRACCEAVSILSMPALKRALLMQDIAVKRGDAGRLRVQENMDRIEPHYVLAMATKEIRRAYLDDVESERGKPARDWLEERIVQTWKERQAAAAAETERQ